MTLSELRDKLNALIKEGYGESEVFFEEDSSRGYINKDQLVDKAAVMVVIKNPDPISGTIFDTQKDAEEFATGVKVNEEDLVTQQFIMIQSKEE